MASQYYYLIASLPYLDFDNPSWISKEMFLEECKKWLTDKDLAALFSAGLVSPERETPSVSVLKEWNEFNTELKGQIAGARERLRKKDSGSMTELAQNIFQQKDPLMKEIRFEKIRWDFLEEKAASYYFDVNFLILYFLKLQIIERIKSFNKDRGDNFFNKLYKGMYEQAKR